MPVNDIIQHAMDNNPLKLKTAFDAEMTTRVRAALNQKYTDMTSEVPSIEDIEDSVTESKDVVIDDAFDTAQVFDKD